MSEDFFANKPLGRIATSQGELLVFNITLGHQNQSRKDLGKRIDKREPMDFARAIMKYTRQRAEAQAANTPAPSPPLTILDVKAFSPEDVETFAQFYVEHNGYLYRKQDPSGAWPTCGSRPLTINMALLRSLAGVWGGRLL